VITHRGYKFAAFGPGPVGPALVYNYFPFKSSNSLEHAKSTLLSGNYVCKSMFLLDSDLAA
jgi:hypothetical protein